MALPTNDDFANRELSIEELEAIAAGGLWGWIKHEVSAAAHEVGAAVHQVTAAVNWLQKHHIPFPKYPIPPYL